MQGMAIIAFGSLVFIVAILSFNYYFFKFKKLSANPDLKEGIVTLFGSAALLFGASSIYEQMLIEGMVFISYIVSFMGCVTLILSAKSIVKSAIKT